MGLLNLLQVPVSFWSHTWGIPFWLSVQRQPAEHPLKKGSSVLCKHIVFQESTKFLGFLACVFCLFTPMLLTGPTCLRAQCFTAVFWGGKQCTKSWRMHSEPLQAATRLCCSLLGNAGRALARAGFASLLWLGPRTHPNRGTAWKQTIWCNLSRSIAVSSGPTSRAVGVSQHPLPASLPSHPSSPHLIWELAFSTMICCTYNHCPASL